jgi:hypothetical protein
MTIPIVEVRMRPRGLTVSHRKKRDPNCGFELMNGRPRHPPRRARRSGGKAVRAPPLRQG